MSSSAWCSPWEVTPENHSLGDSSGTRPHRLTYPSLFHTDMLDACPDWGMLEKRSSRGCVNVARNCREASFKTYFEYGTCRNMPNTHSQFTV